MGLCSFPSSCSACSDSAIDSTISPGRLAASSGRDHTSGHFQHCCSQYPCPCREPLLTHNFAGDPQTRAGRSGSTSCGAAPSLCILVCTRFCVCPLRVTSLFLMVCGSHAIKSPWPSKSDSLGILRPFAGSPALGSLPWGLKPL